MQIYKTIKALGTEMDFYLQSDTDANFNKDLAELEKIIIDFEGSFSRFILTSELNLFNQSSGSFWASTELINILLSARNFYHTTKGIFNPSILPDLERVGYDKSFNLIEPNNDKKVLSQEYKKNDFDLVSIDVANNLISKPANLKIDLGGIGKGYIVDLLIKKIESRGYANFWISAGGDIYLSGLTENKEPYQIGIQNPLKLDEDIASLVVLDAKLAVATSGITKRKWKREGKTYNHIIDPRTGTSVANDLLAVTVISDLAIKTDVFAKTVLILGKEAGLEFINKQDNTEALIIDKNLEFSLSRNMNKYLIKK
jgi:thiamine biosynthesis lipoprotein